MVNMLHIIIVSQKLVYLEYLIRYKTIGVLIEIDQ